MKFPIDKVKNLTLDMGNAQVESKKEVVATDEKTTKQAVDESLVLPAGTQLTLAIQTGLDTARHSKGFKFKSILEANLVSGNKVVAPKGSVVYGTVVESKKAGRLVGKSSMLITFTDVMLNNKLHPIQTSSISITTGRTGASSVGRTARAAAIGGLGDGSKGAKTGAKIGLGVAILSKGDQVSVPSGTLFDIKLEQSLTIN